MHLTLIDKALNFIDQIALGLNYTAYAALVVSNTNLALQSESKYVGPEEPGKPKYEKSPSVLSAINTAVELSLYDIDNTKLNPSLVYPGLVQKAQCAKLFSAGKIVSVSIIGTDPIQDTILSSILAYRMARYMTIVSILTHNTIGQINIQLKTADPQDFIGLVSMNLDRKFLYQRSPRVITFKTAEGNSANVTAVSLK